MKRILIAITLCLGLTVVSQAQTTATMRIIESFGYSKIVVVYETGESKSVVLDPFNLTAKPDKTEAAMVKNQKTINRLIDEMTASGYEVVDVSTAANGGFFERFVIFEKK